MKWMVWACALVCAAPAASAQSLIPDACHYYATDAHDTQREQNCVNEYNALVHPTPSGFVTIPGHSGRHFNVPVASLSTAFDGASDLEIEKALQVIASARQLNPNASLNEIVSVHAASQSNAQARLNGAH